ncbi:MAG: peptidoglycan-binding protein, partial [Ilumatobacteraceae bacterium]
MTKHRTGRAVAVVVVLSVLAAACSGDDDDADDSPATTEAPAPTDGAAPSGTEAGGEVEDPPAPEPVGDPVLTFGFIGPAVGLLSDLAIGQERGLALAVEEINAAGGVLGAPVASVRADEPSSGDVATVLDDLLGQGANAFVGPVGSATAAALIPTLAERQLLTCSASATATSLTVDGNIDWFARTALRDDHLASIVAEDMMAPADGSPAPATVMIVGRDDVYGNELIGALSAELTARGAAVDTIAYPARRVTFVDEAAAVAAAAPDAVVLVSYTEGPNLVNELVAAGTPVDRILGLDGFFVPRLAEQVFPDDATRADGLTVIGTTGDRALMNRLAQVPAAQDQTSYGAQMYDCVISLALATIVAGTTEPPAVGAQLPGVTAGGRTCSTFAHCVQLVAAGEIIDYDGASGHIAFDAAGDISSARVTTSKVIDGVLQPTSVQDIDLVAQQEAAIFAASVFVTQLQRALKVLGYFEGDITGVYDEATTAAVAALQRDLGLPETGQFDEATDAALRERLGTGASTFSASVAQLQQALADRGYYAGPIDGRYTAATAEAVRAFQRDLGVPETGVVDVATLQAIYARGQQTGA